MNVYKLWSVIGFYWFIVCILAGSSELYDLAFLLTFIGYYINWLLLFVSIAVLVDRKLQLKTRVKKWMKE